MLNNDAGYYSFHVINYEDYFVKHGRYISYFTQSLSILIMKLGGSLKSALVAYSVSPALWFYGLFLTAVYFLKSPRGGLFILLSLILTMRYKFYAGHTEITFAIAVACFLIVWILSDKSHLRKWKTSYTALGTLILTGWLLIIHPIIVIPLFMVLGFYFLFDSKFKDPWYWVNLSIIAVLFALRFVFVAKDGYESDKMGLLNDLSVFNDPSEYYVYNIMTQYIDRYIIIAVVVFFLSIILILFKKKLLPALYLLLCASILTVIIIMTHSYLRGDIYIMIDGYIAMYGMIISLSVYYVFSLFPNYYQYFWILATGLVLNASIKIYKKHDFYENRLKQYTQLIKEQSNQGVSKIFLNYHRHDWDIFWFPYEIPLESLIASTLDPNCPQGTIFIDDQNKGYDKVINSKTNFVAFYNEIPLNPRYFETDTSKYVRVVEVPWKD